MTIELFKRNPQTDADVNLLLKRFSDLLPDGRLIEHAEVEQTLRTRRETSQYILVVRHWRRALFTEKRLVLDGRAANGQGFIVLTPDEMVRYSNRRVREAGRILRRAIAVAIAPRDDEIMDSNTRAYRARLVMATEQIWSTHRRTLREIGSPLRPTPALPRAQVPA